MSADRSDKSHAATWILSMAGVLLAYVASIGPVEGLAKNGAIPYPPPRWILEFYAPLNLAEGTPLEKPLLAYIEWWCEFLEKP